MRMAASANCTNNMSNLNQLSETQAVPGANVDADKPEPETDSGKRSYFNNLAQYLANTIESFKHTSLTTSVDHSCASSLDGIELHVTNLNEPNETFQSLINSILTTLQLIGTS